MYTTAHVRHYNFIVMRPLTLIIHTVLLQIQRKIKVFAVTA